MPKYKIFGFFDFFQHLSHDSSIFGGPTLCRDKVCPKPCSEKVLELVPNLVAIEFVKNSAATKQNSVTGFVAGFVATFFFLLCCLFFFFQLVRTITSSFLLGIGRVRCRWKAL